MGLQSHLTQLGRPLCACVDGYTRYASSHSQAAQYNATGAGFPDISAQGVSYSVYAGGLDMVRTLLVPPSLPCLLLLWRNKAPCLACGVCIETLSCLLTAQPGGIAGTSCASPTAAGVFSLVNDQRLAAGKPRECLRTHAKDLRQHCLSLCLAHLRRSLAATPAWRSRPPIAVAHVAAPALGFLNPLIYKNPAAFNDIDTGRVTLAQPRLPASAPMPPSMVGKPCPII